MLAARLLDPTPGSRAVDFCAAPGGKTGHLWERMQGQGTLIALEINPARRREMREALERLYGRDHGIQIPDQDGAAERLDAQSFDRVLVDAPCQALGLIRRHPETRWDERLRFQGAMQKTQHQILESAARLTRPGGRLLWVTCSPTAAENEEIIGGFLKTHPDWWTLDPRPLLRPEWLDWLQFNRRVGADAAGPDGLRRIRDGPARTAPTIIIFNAGSGMGGEFSIRVYRPPFPRP